MEKGEEQDKAASWDALVNAAVTDALEMHTRCLRSKMLEGEEGIVWWLGGG